LRDILTDLDAGSVPDPQRAARQAMKASLPKKFFTEATAGAGECGFRLLLDGRPARTPARNLILVPTQALALELAHEWNRLTDVVDPALMPLTRLVNSAIDGVAHEIEAVADEIAKYSGSDLVCYRADQPAGLVERQSAAWDPVLDFARRDLGAMFVQSVGVLYVEQPARAVAAVRAALPQDPFRLAALNVVTTLTGSALIALGLARGLYDADRAWALAHVDEDWNADHWGRDTLAEQRRAARWQEMKAAATVLATVSEATA
jgi:chaperone required for assembly of F1-ATPase